MDVIPGQDAETVVVLTVTTRLPEVGEVLTTEYIVVTADSVTLRVPYPAEQVPY